MLGIKLKGFRRQADVSCSQGYDDNREEGKDDNVKYDNSKDNKNDKDTNENKIFSMELKNYWSGRSISGFKNPSPPAQT